MSSSSCPLPLIVGFGGVNAAGRSSGHLGYQRLILESLSDADRASTVASLSAMMGLGARDESAVVNGTLVRRIEKALFDPERAPAARKMKLFGKDDQQAKFVISGKDVPTPAPANWTLEPMDEEGRRFLVTVDAGEAVTVDVETAMAVQAAGQLPSGFDPAAQYRSQHHPRGLQLTVVGASDAVQSVGIDWQTIADTVTPDQVAVYSSSVMSQLDATGFGGMLQARAKAGRATSKQLAMGLNTMPADFVNAYILGSVGATAGITGACATFLYNLRQGVEDIRSGRRKVVVVGSAEAPIIPEVMDGYAAMSALASDVNLAKLDGTEYPDYRRASRPFGDNCGFTLAESSQYAVLMADDLAMELGAQVFGAVPAVYVNADGYKKSISAPGAGNYITMAKAVGLARTLLGEDAVRHRSFVQAHGSSTPHNRVTESLIFDRVARAFGIENWPVAAVKAYLGHSLGPASGDQLAASLGVFDRGILPGIKTIDRVADDVYAERLAIGRSDQDLGVDNCQVGFLNSKGFGGNNATAAVFSPTVTDGFLERRYGAQKFAGFKRGQEKAVERAAEYLDRANSGKLDPVYRFGTDLIDEDQIEITPGALRLPGYAHEIPLLNDEGYGDF